MTDNDLKVTRRKLSDYTPDPHNANTGSERGYRFLDDSVTEDGVGRSGLVDKNGVVIAGNQTLEVLAANGIENVIEVETTGNEWVVVKRVDTDLNDDDPNNTARRMAYRDNRVASANLTWSPEQLQADKEAGVAVVEKLWSPVELEIMEREHNAVDAWNPPLSDDAESVHDVVGGFNLSSFWKDLPRDNEVSLHFLALPLPTTATSKGGTVKARYSRTNPTATERIVKTYMRPGDVFYEMCCGWMTFSSTAKCFGFSGKGGDIWDISIEFCKKQLLKMPGDGEVEVVCADCRDTKEPSNTYDFVHSNPPFFNLETYGDSDSDLSATGNYQLWLQAMGDMATEAERILSPGGLSNFVINDYRTNGEVVLMHSDFISAVLQSTNLLLHDIVIAEVMSQSLRFWREDYNRRYTAKCHEYIITFKKPERK